MEISAKLNRGEGLGDRVLKVDHAGEHGAVCIYAAQIRLARYTAKDMLAELIDFQSHEKRHRAIFSEELLRRNVRRCRSYWLCALGGYALGTLTGLLGRKAIAATTVAIETVVLRHLEQQIEVLSQNDKEAAEAISKIVAEEREHRDWSKSHLQTQNIWTYLITPVVALSTEAVIWLGMHL